MLKPPKEKWEGATIRNMHTKTNILCPLFFYPNLYDYELEGSKNNLILDIDKFVARAREITKSDTNRFRVCLHDLRILLNR
jgi:hypothetical protein